MLTIARPVSKISGFAPDLPTPFEADGDVDTDAFAKLCDLQVRAGAIALCVCGAGGEASTLDRAERFTLIRSAVEVARGRILVIVGAGSNSTARAIEFSADAEHAGADAILSVVPYYNKPTQAGLLLHFEAIAGSTGLPIILCDTPSRSACSLADDTVARLAGTPRIIGLADGSGDAGRPARLRSRLGADFRLLSCDDATMLSFLASGGNGCISVTSNIAPDLCRDLYLAVHQGHLAAARGLAVPVATLTDALTLETNPGPLKYALSLCDLMSARVRLPLVEPDRRSRAEIAATLDKVMATYSEGTSAAPALAASRRRRGG